ncbi:hypothetical protein SCHPADRAFT_972909 [Schizopora paradoxa]|uniref:Uncharacterized protein n=1 Tax=Schizopora paradoxa TaxID=27342 RepID=A0A0H2RKK5_9AGAM|nr:hypothetical protein SCHPADRAFT_972909 [Schizopora paradoxa]
MRSDFTTFRAQLIKREDSPSYSTPAPSRSSSETDPDSLPSPRRTSPAPKRIFQTFVPTKVYIPPDINTFARIASPTESPIGFLMPGRGARGIPLRDMLDGDAVEKMAWHDMFFFRRVQYGEIDLYLSWPGYVGHERTQRVDLYDNGERMTLNILAKAVSRFVAEYIKSCETLHCLDRYAKWRISEGNIRLDDITIVSLINTYGNVWQPELAIERRG